MPVLHVFFNYEHFLFGFFLELNIAIENLTKLVPDENKRKFFVRVFKWVVAFATWKYGPKSAVAEVESLQSTFGGDENAAKGVASSVGRLVRLFFFFSNGHY